MHRSWTRNLLGGWLTMIVVGFGVASPPQCVAVLLPGGGNPRTDCYAVFDIQGITAATSTRVVECTEGDPSCDFDGANDSCRFKVAVCLNQSNDEPTCIPPFPPSALKKVTLLGPTRRMPFDIPAYDSAACGSFLDVDVPVKLRRHGTVKKPGKKHLRLVAVSPVKPRRDPDNATLVCMPSLSATTTTTLPCQNPDGGPDQLDLETAENGTDLDNGWTGVAHNFPVDAHSMLKVCLSGCDGTAAKPICAMNGPTGADSLNGDLFGPPLPLLTQGVPVCVVNRYQPVPVTGEVNFLTGEVPPENPLRVQLFSETHFTDTTAVCPRCTGPNATQLGGKGACDSNSQTPGASCTVESIITVANASGDKTYRLSRDCQPTSGTNSGTLNIDMKLTTGTSSLTGPTPCTTPQGPCAIGVQDDNCHGSGCAANNCSGLACNARTPEGQCIDAKGGLSQNCCNDNPANPCFPTAGGGQISRTGQASPPSPAPPDTTYPKTGSGILVTTFCEGATGTCNIDRTTGLPGPGALILPGTQTWLKRGG